MIIKRIFLASVLGIGLSISCNNMRNNKSMNASKLLLNFLLFSNKAFTGADNNISSTEINKSISDNNLVCKMLNEYTDEILNKNISNYDKTELLSYEKWNNFGYNPHNDNTWVSSLSSVHCQSLYFGCPKIYDKIISLDPTLYCDYRNSDLEIALRIGYMSVKEDSTLSSFLKTEKLPPISNFIKLSIGNIILTKSKTTTKDQNTVIYDDYFFRSLVHNDTNIFNLLLKYKFSPNQKDLSGRTLLANYARSVIIDSVYEAVSDCNVPYIKLLFKMGFKNLRGKYDDTKKTVSYDDALSKSFARCPELSKILIDNSKNRISNDVILATLNKGSYINVREMIKYIHEKNRNITGEKILDILHPDNCFYSIHLALFEKNTVLLTKILKSNNSCNIDKPNNYYYHPIHFAIHNWDLESMIILLEHGVNPNILDLGGYSPIFKVYKITHKNKYANIYDFIKPLKKYGTNENKVCNNYTLKGYANDVKKYYELSNRCEKEQQKMHFNDFNATFYYGTCRYGGIKTELEKKLKIYVYLTE